MNIIICLLMFLLAIFVHELTHILIAWYYSKDVPSIRLNKSQIKVMPKTIFTNYQKSTFLGFPIITGMITIYFFFHIYPFESSMTMIAYLISCGADFYNLILLEVNRIK